MYLTRAGSDLLGLTIASATVVEDAGAGSVGADIDQGSGVTVVVVDADNLTTIAGSCSLDVDVTLALGVAVAAGSVDLAVVFGVEVDDLEARALVLEQFILYVEVLTLTVPHPLCWTTLSLAW